MSKLLNFSQFIGGADNSIVVEAFNSEQTTYNYNFANTSVAGYTWDLDSQTIVVDTMAADRITGLPNFTDSKVVGYFPLEQINVATYVNTSDAANGNVAVTIPSGLYDLGILPNSQSNVAISCVGVKWTDIATPSTTFVHRYAIVQRWTPETTIGNPRDEATFIPITIT